MALYTDPEADAEIAHMVAQLPTKPGELDAALRKAKITPAPRQTPRKTPKEPKEKKRKQGYVRKATNTHMPELFQGQQATQID